MPRGVQEIKIVLPAYLLESSSSYIKNITEAVKRPSQRIEAASTFSIAICGKKCYYTKKW